MLIILSFMAASFQEIPILQGIYYLIIEIL